MPGGMPRGLIAPTDRWVGGGFFDGQTMTPPRTVEVELLAYDARDVVRAAGGEGAELPHRLGALLGEGLEQYIRDEAEWSTLAAIVGGAGGSVGESGARRLQILRRREAEALVVSMRARTIASEVEVQRLSARVAALEEENAHFKARMLQLRAEIPRLQRRRDQLHSVLEGQAPERAHPCSLAARLAARLQRLWRRWAMP